MKPLGDLLMENFEFLFKELNILKDVLMEIATAREEPVASMRATLALVDSNTRMRQITSGVDEAIADRLLDMEPKGEA